MNDNTVLDLFSGIGGFSLGLDRAGFETVAFCEIDPYCRGVIAKHWPGRPIYGDIAELTAKRLVDDGVRWPRTLCGGFPCQDISLAGTGAGLAGLRSGLWSEYARLIGEIRPEDVIVENVAALLSRGISVVLRDLAALGYDAEWHCIPASYVGAPHRRDRVWIVAHASGVRLRDVKQRLSGGWPAGICDARQAEPRHDGAQEPMADAAQQHGSRLQSQAYESGRRRADLADTEGRGLGTDGRAPREGGHIDVGGAALPDAEFDRLEGLIEGGPAQGPTDGSSDGCYSRWWESEPTMGMLVDGVSDELVRFNGRTASGVQNRTQKLQGLGNAVLPQIPEMIGRAIMVRRCQK